MSDQSSQLHYDAARTDQSEDEFDFDDLGRSVATSISQLLEGETNSASFVVGIEGRWGSGKSTILNFVRKELSKALAPETHFFVDFDPWWLEEKANIPAALLLAVLSALPPKPTAKPKRVFQGAASAAGNIPEGAEILLKLFKKTEGIGDLLGSLRQAGGDFDKVLSAAKTPRRLRQEVAAEFKSKGYRFVVFIDDLDRLSPDQALQVMSAIRSIADLPGFVYVLAYDAEALSNILAHANPPVGHEYFDKIVNISIPVPPITSDQMKRFLLKLLGPLLREPLAKLSANNHRNALIGLLTGPRDAIRLANAANFWVGPKLDEVYAPDFLLLEAVRLAHPNAYTGILRTSDVWTDTVPEDALSFALDRDRDKNEHREKMIARVQRELDLTEGAQGTALKVALSTLFPNAASFFGTENGFIDRQPTTDERRVENRRHFFTYFLHRPTPGTPTRKEVEGILEPTIGFEERARRVREVASRPAGDVQPSEYLMALLDAERERGHLSRRVDLELVRAMLDVTIEPKNPTDPSSTLATDVDLVRAFATNALEQAGSLSDDEALTLFVPSLPISLLGSLHLVLTAGTDFYLLEDNGSERIVQCSDDALRAVTHRLIERIFGSLQTGELYKSSIAPRLLHMANKFDPDRFSSAMAQVYSSDEGLISLSESFLGYNAPIQTLVRYSGLSATELQSRVQSALMRKGIKPEIWEPWKWYSSIVDWKAPPTAE